MSAHVLHLLDHTTSADAIAALAHLLTADQTAFPIHHHLAILGHRSTAKLLAHAGLPDFPVRWLPSMGWADPTGWRALRRLIRELCPTHLHSWGTPAAVAAAVSRSTARQIVTLSKLPSSAAWMLLRALDTAEWRAHAEGDPGPTTWVAATQSMARHLKARLRTHDPAAAGRVHYVAPAVKFNPAAAADLVALRHELELPADQYPVLLLAGDASGRARHDFGLWVGGILQTIFPHVRVIVREDPRGRRDIGLERLLNNLSDGNIPILAPAEFSWDHLLAVSDLLLISADGPVEIAAALHAMAAGIPVVGTPVDAVREIFEDGRNGLIATRTTPRAITAPVEKLLSDAPLCQRLTTQARQDARERHSPAALVAAYQGVYENIAESVVH